MKRKLCDFIFSLIANLAYYEAKESVNSACLFWHHQPEIPNAVLKLKKDIKE